MPNAATIAIALGGWIVAAALWMSQRRRRTTVRLDRGADPAHDAVLTMLAHELRTPLTAMLGFTEIASQSSLDHEQRGRCLDRVLTQGRHLLRLFNDVFDFVRLREGRLTIHPVDCELRTLARELEQDVRPAAEAKGLLLDIRVDDALPQRVRIDSDRVRQIARTLLHNAVKFTRRGHVGARFSELGNDRLLVRIHDTGPGIASGLHQDLFADLRSGDRSHARRHPGVGLGLALVGRLVERLDGTIRVASEVGRGSQFEVEVPFRAARRRDPMLAPLPRAAPVTPTETTRHPIFDGSVLLVDDSQDNQLLMRHVLRRLGLDADVAENGRVALRALDRASYDLVLMDMQMPVLDGYEATRALRARGDATPVVALTAHALSGDREKCLASGCDDFLTKPLDRDELERVLERYLTSKTPLGRD